MEPFRPVVDRVVAKLREERGTEAALDKESKKLILAGLLSRFTANEESRTLFDWISRTASSLVAVMDGTSQKLEIPRL